MLTYTFKNDDQVWLVINALADKVAHWNKLAKELREHLEKSGQPDAQPWSGLAQQLERQAEDADRIKNDLIIGEEG